MIISDDNPGRAQISLILSPPEKLKENNIEIIKEITKESDHSAVIIITINQPAQYLRELYSIKGIDLEKVTFIDAITKYAMGKADDDIPQCIFLNNPADLTSLSIAVSETLKKMEGKKPCIFIDSVNAMLIYLPSTNITKFIHFVTNKLRIFNLSGIYLAAESGLDPVIMSQLLTFTDKVINMDGDEKSE
ncbi:MAG: hypothetical protein JXQ82_02610 [Methanomicrobiaceae archaeon]|nr:hypothetical protein [Methanomicrobiaceae archaeon]